MARSARVVGEKEVGEVGSRDRRRGRGIHETHSSLKEEGEKEGAALRERTEDQGGWKDAVIDSRRKC